MPDDASDFIELMARWAEDAGMIDAGVHAAVGRGGDAAVGEAPDADAGLVGIQPVKRRGRGLDHEELRRWWTPAEGAAPARGEAAASRRRRRPPRSGASEEA